MNNKLLIFNIKKQINNILYKNVKYFYHIFFILNIKILFKFNN